MQPDTFIKAVFPEALPLNRAVIIHPTNQHFSEFAYFGRNAHGEWRLLEARTSEEFLPVRLAEGRAWAGQELYRQGIDYLVGNTSGDGYNMIVPVIESDPSAWGLSKVFEDGSLRTYRVLGPAAASFSRRWCFRRALTHPGSCMSHSSRLPTRSITPACAGCLNFSAGVHPQE